MGNCRDNDCSRNIDIFGALFINALGRHKMILMPSNNTGQVVKHLFFKYPDRIALMLNPTGYRPIQLQFKHAIDNACFKQFSGKLFFDLLEHARGNQNTIFAVCPDVVGCHERTLALWHCYHERIESYGMKVAFVAQNGCSLDAIPKRADFVFIGGTDPWKMDNVHKFTRGYRPVHVGRVNSIDRLVYCEQNNVYSVDGTGWMRARDKKFYDMHRWFKQEFEQRELF